MIYVVLLLMLGVPGMGWAEEFQIHGERVILHSDSFVCISPSNNIHCGLDEKTRLINIEHACLAMMEKAMKAVDWWVEDANAPKTQHYRLLMADEFLAQWQEAKRACWTAQP